jgi:hypothetical protein
VAWTIRQARAMEERGDQAAAIRRFRQAFTAARSPGQVAELAEILGGLGQTVDLPKHFGFLRQWQLVGPFDNTNMTGWDKAYPPESEVSLSAVYPGKLGRVEWFDFSSEDDYGVVDLNDAFGRPRSADRSGFRDTPDSLPRYKGVIAYAYCEFFSDMPRAVQLRLGSKNGHKVWLNGQLVMTNNVYHAGMFVDQYVGSGHLRKGRNSLLVKVSQNEQSESWAQDWNFQLRICDQYGTAILSTEP